MVESNDVKPLTVLLTAEERALLERAADAAGRIAVSVWLRQIALERAREILAAAESQE
jgi:uncharacterized protein (DUF1778 family)